MTLLLLGSGEAHLGAPRKTYTAAAGWMGPCLYELPRRPRERPNQRRQISAGGAIISPPQSV